MAEELAAGKVKEESLCGDLNSPSNLCGFESRNFFSSQFIDQHPIYQIEYWVSH